MAFLILEKSQSKNSDPAPLDKYSQIEVVSSC